MNMLKIKNINDIKNEACNSDVSLAKVLETYCLNLDDVGLFFIDKNIIECCDDEKNYPINIFYSLQKDEIHQLKVDFTHTKIKDAVRVERNKNYTIAS